MNIVPLFFNNKEEGKMATQIRKFEQEAIVDTITDKIETELKSKRTELIKDDRDYESMLSDANYMKALGRDIDDLTEKRNLLYNSICERVQEWNVSNSSYALDINRYQGVLSLNPKLSSYHLKEKIGNKVAIALLPKDAIENMDTIISNITKEFV